MAGILRVGRLIQFLEAINRVLNIVDLVNGFLFVRKAGVDGGQHQTKIVGPFMVVRSHHRRIGGARRSRMGDGDTGAAHGKGA